jgi:uncharacterized membrane protein
MNNVKSLQFGLVYLLLDAIWLFSMTPAFYRPKFEQIQKTKLRFNPIYAVIAYALLLFTLFAICIPLVRVYPTLHPSLVFAMVGLVMYGVYNMTNAAVFNHYDLDICVVDIVWGTSSFAMMGLLYEQLR